MVDIISAESEDIKNIKVKFNSHYKRLKFSNKCT